MKIPTSAILTSVALNLLFFVSTNPAAAQDKAPSEALLARAKISHAEAEKIALKAVPNGTVKSSELEEEDGGLRWSFDLKTPASHKITEVGVDAVTGKIVENKLESEKDEANEKEDEKHEKKH